MKIKYSLLRLLLFVCGLPTLAMLLTGCPKEIEELFGIVASLDCKTDPLKISLLSGDQLNKTGTYFIKIPVGGSRGLETGHGTGTTAQTRLKSLKHDTGCDLIACTDITEDFCPDSDETVSVNGEEVIYHAPSGAITRRKPLQAFVYDPQIASTSSSQNHGTATISSGATKGGKIVLDSLWISEELNMPSIPEPVALYINIPNDGKISVWFRTLRGTKKQQSFFAPDFKWDFSGLTNAQPKQVDFNPKVKKFLLYPDVLTSCAKINLNGKNFDLWIKEDESGNYPVTIFAADSTVPIVTTRIKMIDKKPSFLLPNFKIPDIDIGF